MLESRPTFLNISARKSWYTEIGQQIGKVHSTTGIFKCTARKQKVARDLRLEAVNLIFKFPKSVHLNINLNSYKIARSYANQSIPTNKIQVF